MLRKNNVIIAYRLRNIRYLNVSFLRSIYSLGKLRKNVFPLQLPDYANTKKIITKKLC